MPSEIATSSAARDRGSRSSVAIIGSGLIGRGWMILFANAGYEVRVYDAGPEAPQHARAAIANNLALLEAQGMIADADALAARIHYCGTLAESLAGACHVQESVWEDRALKQRVLEEIGAIAEDDAVIASSCSTIPPDSFMGGIRNRERCIIAHPFSPPHLIPLVEIVPSSWTAPDVVERTTALMTELGQRPVLIRKPVAGFAVNRLQAVVIDEAMALVRDGVISPEDLDACMSQGLGLRWAFIGPFETMDLNADNGIGDYVRKYRDCYYGILDTIRPPRPWDEAVQSVDAWRRTLFPNAAHVAERRLWRDLNLMKLAKLFRGSRLGRSE